MQHVNVARIPEIKDTKSQMLLFNITKTVSKK